MKKLILVAIISCALVIPQLAGATNGDNMIAIGPIARSMGGVGIAQPQDAISAVFANPAAMCFADYCNGTEFDFAGTLFMPDASAKITNFSGTYEADSDDNVYAIPAIGLSVPISDKAPFWRFGLAAYGVSGLGVDYRDSAIDNPTFYNSNPNYPMVTGEYTQLQIMKFAPAIAFQPTHNLSLGLALQVDYGSLDLKTGASVNYGYGAQLGMTYMPTNTISLGLTYTTPQSIDHDKVADLDQDGTLDTLKLEAPQQLGAGVAFEMMDNKLILETDVKWINWSSANGYEEFDWDDQYVFALGGQYQATDKFVLRAGYNYASNPVNNHSGFTGTSISTVQGKSMPTYYYETFRIIGFPAIVEQHITCGFGYEFTKRFSMNLGYMYAFEETLTETGTDLANLPVTIESSLSEQSLDFGLTWLF